MITSEQALIGSENAAARSRGVTCKSKIVLLERCNLIKWDRFQIGAFGKLAISTGLVTVVMIFLAKLLSLW